MTLKLYGLRTCSTCAKAMAWLDAQGLAYRFFDVKEHRPSADQITAWSKALGGWEKLINRSSMTWRGLSQAAREDLTEPRAGMLGTEHPALIRRPLIE